MLKKIKVVLLAGAILVSGVPQMTYANSVDKIDVPSSWAQPDIEVAKNVGILPSGLEGNYRESITRSEFSELAVVLYENLSKKNVSVQIDNPFDDTEDLNAIIAHQLGIMHGRGHGEFDPDTNITREEASSVLYNTLKVAKSKYKYEGSYITGFDDDEDVANWAKEAVEYLYAIEVINGTTANVFKPKGETTREDAISLAKRVHEKNEETERSSRGAISIVRGDEPVVEEEVPVQKPSDVKKAKLKQLLANQMGKPYQWGGTGPNSYDCSGLTYSMFGKLGIKIGRVSGSQINSGTPVGRNNLEYGDLLLFARDGRNINHVGIYVGNGNFVHSPKPGDVVRTASLSTRYFANSYYAARRLIK